MEIHGRRLKRTWTLLARTAEKGTWVVRAMKNSSPFEEYKQATEGFFVLFVFCVRDLLGRLCVV